MLGEPEALLNYSEREGGEGGNTNTRLLFQCHTITCALSRQREGKVRTRERVRERDREHTNQRAEEKV